MARLFLLFHGRFPGEKAASLFAAKSAEAFASQGFTVTVLVPKRKGVDARSACEYFGVADNFSIKELPVKDYFSRPIPKKAAFSLSFLFFALACRKFLKKESREGDIFYSNESLPLYAVSFLGRKTFYEMHDFPESKLGLFGMMVGRFDFILIHNRWKVDKFKREFPRAKAKIICEPNAVQLEEFDIPLSREEARKRLGLPLDKKIAVYTGHLFGWKGADTLAEAAKKLSDEFKIVFVGGTERDIASFKEKYGRLANVSIVGHKPHREIPVWQKAADLLVLPNTAKEDISKYYTSPMKLFEYMASGRPIIASDIPSIREIVDEKTAILVKPDDPEALAEAIKKASDSDHSAMISESLARVRERTWTKRSARIMEFIQDEKA